MYDASDCARLFLFQRLLRLWALQARRARQARRAASSSLVQTSASEGIILVTIIDASDRGLRP